MLVTYSLPNLVGGISQQPPSLRVPNAHEDEENSWPSLVAGLQKRPGTSIVAKLGTALSGSVAGHSYYDPVSDQTFFIAVKDDSIRVFNQAGAEKTVNGTLNPAYMDFGGQANDFCQMQTVGDTTFILNKAVTVTSSAVAEDGSRVNPSGRWTIFVKEAVPNSYYTIYVNGSKYAEFLTGANVDAATALESTAKIAQELYNDLSGAGFTVALYSSVVTLSTLDAYDVEVYSEGRAGKSLVVFKEAVEDFSDLPPFEEEGRLLRVQGDLDSKADDYYVFFNSDKLWQETHGYNAGRQLDDTTMPYALVYNQATDKFDFEPYNWAERVVGDATTSPPPTFVGRTISSIFFHQGRFGFLTDENLVMSEADTYDNFWRTTVVILVDSDPIDVAAATGSVSILNHAVPYNRNLLLFSDTSQYVVNSGEILSPKTVVASYTTSYAASILQTPTTIGPYVYFVDDSGTHLRLMEYFSDNNTLSDNAEDMTIQVPELIPAPVKDLQGSSRMNIILVQGNDESTLYVYRFMFGKQTKIQSSWFKWTFDGNIQYYTFYGNYLYLFINYSDGLFLERLRIEEDVVRSESSFPICLDHQITLSDCTVSYNSSTDLTTITTPYAYEADVVLISAPGASNSGIQYPLTNTTGNTYTTPGDVSGLTTAIIGNPYRFYWKLSTQFIREQKGQGEVVVQDGRLSLRYMSLQYRNTFSFDVTVTLQGSQSYTYTFEGRTLGSPSNLLGGAALDTGEFRFPIMGENTTTTIEVSNSSPYPNAFTACEWQAQWRPKSRKRL